MVLPACQLPLGVAYLDAGLYRDAWEALMAACAQPRLARPLAKCALLALAEAAEKGANASKEALQQARGLRKANIFGKWRLNPPRILKRNISF